MKKTIKKAQNGAKKSPVKKPTVNKPAVYKSPWGEKTPDSTAFFKSAADDYMRAAKNMDDEAAKEKGMYQWRLERLAENYRQKSKSAMYNMQRQSKKGQPGYDKNGRISSGNRPNMKSGGKVMAKKTMKKK